MHACSRGVALPARLDVRVDGAGRRARRRGAAVDALRRQRSGGARRVAALAARAARGPPRGHLAPASVPDDEFDRSRRRGSHARASDRSGRCRRALAALCRRQSPRRCSAARDRREPTLARTDARDPARAHRTRCSPGRCRPSTRAATTTPRSPPAACALTEIDPVDDGVARLPRPVSRRRNPRRRRPPRRLQLSVGVVYGRIAGEAAGVAPRSAGALRVPERAGWGPTRVQHQS